MGEESVDRTRRPASSLPSLAGLDPEALRALLVGWGEAPWRALQVFEAVHRRWVLDPADITTIPRTLRARLADAVVAPATRLLESQRSRDGTTKLLLGLRDERRIETVIIPEGGRRTVCVSTQVGCPVGCVFCASGVAGLYRNLSTGEIVEQTLQAARIQQARPSHVVVMGMGEPLLNLDRLAAAIRLWTHPEGLGLSPRRVTVSTATRGDLIDRLAGTGLRVELAVSLHAPDDETRARLVPTSGPGRVRELVDAAARYAQATGRDATAEYVLIAGENDRPDQADRLGRLLAGRHVHVNLIPLNPVSHRPDLVAPTPDAAQAFAARVRAAGASVTLRTQRGEDIAAACGQLALERAAGPAPEAGS